LFRSKRITKSTSTLAFNNSLYLVSPQFVEVQKIFELPREIGFISRLALVTGLREQELLYIKEKQVCVNGYGCDCQELHLVNCKNGMTIIARGCESNLTQV
jgi:hypothetical protein